MESLFKSVGKGLLYLLVLPFFLLVITGYAVAGLLVFIYLFFKSIILFFSGRSLNIELPEDKRAKEIIQNAIPTSANPVIKQDGAPQAVVTESIVVNPVSTSFFPLPEPSSVEEACFGVGIEKELPLIEQEQPIIEQEPIPVVPVIEERKPDIKEKVVPQNTVSPSKYSPKKTRFDEFAENEDKGHKAESGVDIDFKDF